MPYRRIAAEAHDEYLAEEADELRAVSAEQRRRRRRTAYVVAAVVLGHAAAPFVAASASPRRPRIACHNVEIQWENARHLPPHRWQACEER